MARRRSTNKFGHPVNWRARARFLAWTSERTTEELLHEMWHYCAGSNWKFQTLDRIVTARTNDEERVKAARANQAALMALMPEEVEDEAC